MIEVAAPRDGDPLFTIRREMSGVVRDGDVFVRRVGKTDRASSAEIAALVKRARSNRTLGGLDVSLQRPSAIRPVDFSEEAIHSVVASFGAMCLRSLEEAKRKAADLSPPGTVVFGKRSSGDVSALSFQELRRLEERKSRGEQLESSDLAQLEAAQMKLREAMGSVAAAASVALSMRQEDRTPEEYREEVQSYLQELQTDLLSNARAGASSLLEPCVFKVSNETPSNLPEVEIVLYVPGDATACEPDMPAPGLPGPPRAFGPYKVDPLASISDTLRYQALQIQSQFPAAPFGEVHIENGGSATLRFEPVHLRPHSSVFCPP
ncbi:hypothetical protein [Geodermatophilus siccatus]|uniref:hypothetical protein n=1 Tax=Geodermatophilus siccatus TaxID=1137991 RepID=UPI00111421A8|nr:hypothetical protein [Geodermatophilus siccatus]